MERTEVQVDGGLLAARAAGDGEPVLIIQTALSVDELAPLSVHRQIRDRYRVVTFDRRGYAGSSAIRPAGSIEVEADDCLRVMRAVDAFPAHVVGVSYSAAVALTLTASAPKAVRTVTVVEPPPRHVPASDEFLEANAQLLSTYRAGGIAAALDAFMTVVIGPDWRARQESLAPGSVARIERDAGAFFAGDIPALVSWEYGPEQAGRAVAPILYVGGSESGSWFRQTREWVAGLFPGAASVTISGAGHDLAMTHPGEARDSDRAVPRTSGLANARAQQLDLTRLGREHSDDGVGSLSGMASLAASVHFLVCVPCRGRFVGSAAARVNGSSAFRAVTVRACR